MNWKKIGLYIFLVLLFIVAAWLKNRNQNTESNQVQTPIQKDKRGLNRNPHQINYSKHARCRMDCRRVSESEVEELLQNGKINYKKSDLQGETCRKKYAVEGVSRDKQKLRIIFSPCADEVTVVTVIDLDTEWECTCE